MANWYVYSGAGGTASGADWTNAKLTLAAAATASAAGDSIWVAHDHAESTASAQTITIPGTVSNPSRVICVNRAGSVPPVAADIRATGSVSTTGASDIAVNGFSYIEGLIFAAASGASAGAVNIGGSAADHHLVLKNCQLRANGTAAASGVYMGPTGQNRCKVELINTTMKFSSTAQGIICQEALIVWRDTPSAIDATGSFPTTLIKSSTDRGTVFQLEGVDLSQLGSGKTLVGDRAAFFRWIARNCKLGASVTRVATLTSAGSGIATFINCNSGAVNYDSSNHTALGSQVIEATVVRTNGASDGTTPVSWKITTTANAKLWAPYECIPIIQWIDTTGSSKTVTIETLTDNITLTNNDCWIDVQALDSASAPLSGPYTSFPATVLTTPTNNTSSGASWTTTGVTTPVAQNMSATFTPGMKGYFALTVRVAKASVAGTLWIDPLVTVT